MRGTCQSLRDPVHSGDNRPAASRSISLPSDALGGLRWAFASAGRMLLLDPASLETVVRMLTLSSSRHSTKGGGLSLAHLEYSMAIA